MNKIVIDASVAVKCFVPEIHSAAAARFLDPVMVLHAPDLIVPEFGNVLWKKVRRSEISRNEAEEILNAFAKLPLELHLSTVLIDAAFELALQLDRTVYDTLYLAVAVAEECVLVTADAKFHSVLRASRLADHALWIEEEV